jgi:hypothetical protein
MNILLKQRPTDSDKHYLKLKSSKKSTKNTAEYQKATCNYEELQTRVTNEQRSIKILHKIKLSRISTLI